MAYPHFGPPPRANDECRCFRPWPPLHSPTIAVTDADRIRTLEEALQLSVQRERERQLEIERLREQLRRAQRLAALGRLAGAVVHDFNTLLCAIGGYAHLMLRRLGTEDPLRRNAEHLLQASDKAGGLVRQLLAFSRKPAQPGAAVDLNSVVQALEGLLVRVLGDDVELVTRLEGGLPAVCGDPGQIEQVLFNLAANARDAMPQGGRLSIVTRDAGVVERRREPRSSTGVPRHHVCVEVADTGCGMDDDTRARIFDPFFTTKGPDRGTGLGLATVHGIVSQSGGHIEVSSAPGRGTTFRIFLPAITRVEVAAPAPARAVPPPRGQETVLLLEDEALLRSAIEETLAEHGYKVLSAPDADEALRLFEQQDHVDVLLADVVLPKKSGPEVARALTERDPSLRVLYMSGRMDQILFARTQRAGAIAFLPKPFTPDVLLEKMRAVLQGPPPPTH